MFRYILKRCAQMIPTVGGVILITFVLFNIVGGSPATMTLGQHVSPQALEEFDEQRGFNKPLLCGWWTDTRAMADLVFENNIGPWRSVPNTAHAAPAGRDPGCLVLSAVGGSASDGKPNALYPVPLAFPLSPDTRYQLTVTYRLAEGGSAELQIGDQLELDSQVPRLLGWPGRSAGGNPALRSVATERDGHLLAIPKTIPKNFELTNSVLAEGGAMPPDVASGVIQSEGHNFPLPCSPDWKTLRLPIRTGPGTLNLAFNVKGQPLEIRSLTLRRRMAHPLDSQLVFYLRQIARLDFGVSSSMNQPVSRLLRQGIMPSLALTVPILLVELIVSVVLALVCAFFRNTIIDRFFVVFSVALMSVNYLVWIVAGQYLLAYRLHWFPLWGFESWRCLLLPVAIGVVSGLGANVRFYRAIMLDEMYRDYVRTAFAKGVSRSGVLFRHVLKNAMIPIITNVVIALPFLYTGSLLLESFFGIPGLGYLSVNAFNSADIDVVRAVVLIGSILFVAANLVADICYALVDPRVKLG